MKLELDGQITSLIEETALVHSKFKKRLKITASTTTVVNGTVHIHKERNARIFQNQDKYKMQIFISLYEVTCVVLKTCDSKTRNDAASRVILSKWGLDVS